jgi:TatD DNase family protein
MTCSLLEAALHANRDDPQTGGCGRDRAGLLRAGTVCEPAQGKAGVFLPRTAQAWRARFGLPVVLHVRRSADRLLKHLRDLGAGGPAWSGIAHAFNGSDTQASAFVGLGFKLGFGGAVTFERALQLRRLVRTLPLDALVLETDAPDIPPHWLYTPAQTGWPAHRKGATRRANCPKLRP